MKNDEAHGGSFLTGIVIGGAFGALVAYLFVTPAGRRITRKMLDVAEEVAAHGDTYVGIEQKQDASIATVTRKLQKKGIDRT